MGFKDLFFVKEETEQAPAQEPVGIKKEDVYRRPAPSVQPTMPVSSPAAVNVNPSEDMVSKIWDQIINRNLPGPDYLELRNNASALEDLPLTEEQRLEAAFKVLKKAYPNLTKDVILKSIDTYMGVVEEERNAGIKECHDARLKCVGEKESRLKVMKDTNAETLRQIEELKKQYDESMASIANLEREITSAQEQLDAKEAMFNASIENALAVLRSDKNKISTLNL
jgi:Mg2+ and Co2+ transporter CorA